MNIEYALIAEGASLSGDGKLTIFNEFNVIWGDQVPITWPKLAFVARIEGGLIEGSSHKAILVLVDDDGNKLMESPEFDINLGAKIPLVPLATMVSANLVGLKFPEFGDYEFHLLVDGQLLKSKPLYVRQRLAPSS